MTNLTYPEQAALESVKQICGEDYSADIERISSDIGMSQSATKGIIGSLVKKDRVICEQEERTDRLFYDIFYKSEDGNVLSYGEWS